MATILEEIITKGINQRKISKKIFGKALYEKVPYDHKRDFMNVRGMNREVAIRSNHDGIYWAFYKEVSYDYNGKRNFMNAPRRNREVAIRVNDEIYVKLNRKKIKGKVLEIYEYTSKDNVDPPKIYLAKIDFGVTNFTLHIHPKTMTYRFSESKNGTRKN